MSTLSRHPAEAFKGDRFYPQPKQIIDVCVDRAAEVSMTARQGELDEEPWCRKSHGLEGVNRFQKVSGARERKQHFLF